MIILGKAYDYSIFKRLPVQRTIFQTYKYLLLPGIYFMNYMTFSRHASVAPKQEFFLL